MKTTLLIALSLISSLAFAETKSSRFGSYEWTDGAVYDWTSGGNHPDHKTVTLKTENGEDIILVHADDTYGTNQQNYTINITKNSLDLTYLVAGHLKGSSSFDLEVTYARPDAVSVLKDLQTNLRKVAEGYNWGPIAKEPSPQLLPLASYFDYFTKR